jgi:NAD(P)H-dependent FMN reductase
MKFLIIVGTSREGRNSIYPAEEAWKRFEDAGHEAELFDLKNHEIPFLGNRRHRTENPHPDVEKFGQKVEEADGLVLVTPEYNHSYSGELKNAIDHLYPEYDGKPFFFITVSAGGFGGIRAQMHLENVVCELSGHPGPGLPISNVSSIFENGELVDENYESRFDGFVEDCVSFCKKFQ